MVGIRGDLDSLQTSIDFYLSITSKDAVLDSRTMRDRFFKMFQDEDKYREENFLVYQEKVSDDYKVNHDVEPILMGEEAVFEEGVCYFEEEVDYGEEVEEVGNIEAEEDDFVSEVYEEVEDNFANWGSSNGEETDDTEEEEEDDFVNWGSEEEDEVAEEVESYEGAEEDEEDDFVNWGNESEDDFENWGNEDVEEDEDAYSGWGSDEEVAEEDINSEEDEVFSSWGDSEEVQEDDEEVAEPLEKVEEADDLDFGMFDASFDFEEEVVQPKNKVEKVEVKETQDTISEVPKDLREFIKMYPNCEISVALKYFSKKEIDKQLSLGRVFKRKNKLMI